jgi:hypothetical protein
MGMETRLYANLEFEHARPRGAKHQFTYWGAAMGGLGYHPLYVIGRITRNALIRSIGVKGAVNMLRGYLQSHLGSDDLFISPFDDSLRQFVKNHQKCRIQRIVATILRSLASTKTRTPGSLFGTGKGSRQFARENEDEHPF